MDCIFKRAIGTTSFAQNYCQKQTKLNTCNKFCLETDTDCEAMYQIWLKSPKGQAEKLSKQKALYEDKRLMDCVTITCAEKCVANMPIDVSCE